MKSAYDPQTLFLTHYHVVLKLAAQFIPQITFYPEEQILDVGCRNGKITGLLAHLNPDSTISALTTSNIFLNAIKQDPTLQTLSKVHFEQADVTEFNYKEKYDKVVSFSCLTWYENKEKIVSNIYQSLKPGAKAYLQFFVDHGQDWFDACIFAIAAKPEWKSYFQQFKKKVDHIKPGAFLSQAEKIGFVIQQSNLPKRQVLLPNEQYFKHWLITWSSHFSYLPPEKVDAFFDEVVEYYIYQHPKDNLGRITYEDYFFEVVLLKR